MTATTLKSREPFGEVSNNVLTFQRMLPGPIERVWSYITDSEKRRKWLAAGDMTLEADSPFEFVWRNEELSDPPGQRPEGFDREHRMTCRVISVDAPRELTISWGVASEVSFSLEPRGDRVLLTLVHRHAPDRDVLLKVSAGWHAHLDVLVARLADQAPLPFWPNWLELREAYDERLPK